MNRSRVSSVFSFRHLRGILFPGSWLRGLASLAPAAFAATLFSYLFTNISNSKHVWQRRYHGFVYIFCFTPENSFLLNSQRRDFVGGLLVYAKLNKWDVPSIRTDISVFFKCFWEMPIVGRANVFLLCINVNAAYSNYALDHCRFVAWFDNS